MNTIHFSHTAIIPAPAPVVYGILADYHHGHPSILPKAFTKLVVIQGGYGEGTQIEAFTKVMGRESSFKAHITEPEPGRVLVEDTPATGLRTVFTVDPVADGLQSRVTFDTDYPVDQGISGMIQRFIIPVLLGMMYREEMENLNRFAQQKNSDNPSS